MTGCLALLGGRLLDGTGAPPCADAVLLIQGDRIAAVGSARDLGIPDGARRVDCAGFTIMPGLIDAHTHVAEDGHPSALRRLQDTAPSAAIRSAIHAARILDAGFTTIRDLGAFGFSDVATRRAIDDGLIRGPRMLVAGHMLVPSGTEEDGYLRPEVQGYRSAPERGTADGPDALRRAVRFQIFHGADVIKIAATGRIFSDAPGGPAVSTFDDDELRAVCAEAHRHGLRVAAHAYGAAGIRAAVEAGVDSVEHGACLDDDTAELMGKRGTFLVPTFSMLRRAVEHAAELPRAMAERARALADAHVASFGRARAAGVRIVLGTDCGNPFVFPGENAAELELLVEAGASTMEAIVGGTSRASELLGLSHELGSLQPGRLADLLVVDGDPLSAIGVLRDHDRIKLVMRGGVPQRSALPSVQSGIAGSIQEGRS
jgi:imidazolonepropionase-like amidohydrolase